MKIVLRPGIFHADEILGIAILVINKHADYDSVERRDILPDDLQDPNTIVFGNGFTTDSVVNNYSRRFDNERNQGIAGTIWEKYHGQSEETFIAVKNRLIQPTDQYALGIHTGGPTFAKCINTFNGLPEPYKLKKAIEFAYCTLFGFILQSQQKQHARDIIRDANIVNENIMVLKENIRWKGIIFNNPKYRKIEFVILPTDTGNYQMLAIPVTVDSLVPRCPIPDVLVATPLQIIADRLKLSTTDSLIINQNRRSATAATAEDCVKIAMYVSTASLHAPVPK